MNTDFLQIILSILSGLAVTIPLAIKLVEYVQKATKERNWSELMKLTIGFMETAEKEFTDGATKKKWVLDMVSSSAKSIDYDLDETSLAKISDMIDGVCDAAKIINTTKEETLRT